MAFLRHILLCLMLSGLIQPAHAQTPEYSLKAVFIYNFCQFIDWPDSAFAARSTPLIIGIIGNDPFDGELEATVRGEVLRGRPLRVEHYRRLEDARRCHLLFIADSERGRTSSILASLRGTSIVTVGETNDFVSQGGMIALIADGNRVRLQINPVRLRTAQLAVSSKLLRVAEVQN